MHITKLREHTWHHSCRVCLNAGALVLCFCMFAALGSASYAYAEEAKEQSSALATHVDERSSSTTKEESTSSTSQASKASVTASQKAEQGTDKANAQKSTQESSSSASVQLETKSTITAESSASKPSYKGVWKRNSRGWWYEFPDGKYLINGIYTIDNVNYHFLPSGYMSTGWVWTNNHWYYFRPNGSMATGWVFDSGSWYFLSGQGVMHANSWIQDKGRWYYLGSNGAMKTGWFKSGSTWYYLARSGAMETGWVKDGSAWYYLNNNGAMLTGWQTIKGQPYYLDPSGAMQVGWVQLNGQWYYFNSTGSIARDRWVGNYYVNHDGIMPTHTYVGDYYVNYSGHLDASYTGDAPRIETSAVPIGSRYKLETLRAHSSNYTKGREGRSIDYIVLHYTANGGSSRANLNYFSGPNRKASAHYFVDGTGMIGQSVEDIDTAWAVGKWDMNTRSISIEVVSAGEDYSEAEITQLRFLVPYLMKLYNVPRSHVIRHFDVSGKLCPLPYINNHKWEALKDRILS